jgi:hypothetical protein
MPRWSYAQWYAECDRICLEITKGEFGIEDLCDWRWMADYENNVGPKTSVKNAIKYAGGF